MSKLADIYLPVLQHPQRLGLVACCVELMTFVVNLLYLFEGGQLLPVAEK